MIYGIGIDLVELKRIARILENFDLRFARRILHPSELDCMPSLENKKSIAWLAARFAAKEAAVKALGTGFNFGISCLSFAVRADSLGKPQLVLYDKAKEYAEKEKITSAHISITHEKHTAAAVVVFEKD